MALKLEDLIGDVKSFLDAALAELEETGVVVLGKEIDHVRTCFPTIELRVWSLS